MKYIIIIVISFISTWTFGQQLDYANWKEQAKSNIRLLPKYGNVSKTKEQKAIDSELIKTYIAQEGTKRDASELLIKLGYDYLYRGDIKTAMYRFNQAWLLDPQNDNVYWGFGAIYFTFKDYNNAIKQYEEGLVLNPNNSNIITDKATIYLTKYHQSNNQKDVDKAIELFKKSYSIEPKNQNTLFKLSVCYFMRNDCNNAWKYYTECKKLGGKPITKEYTEALTQKCKK